MPRPRGRERRKHLRIDQNLPLKIAAGGYDFATKTKNISCVGAYCHLAKYIPPFTKIAVKLTLPILNKKGVENTDVECKGVIVRSEDEEKGGFNIAIFFNRIAESHKKKISRYIQQVLPRHPGLTAKS